MPCFLYRRIPLTRQSYSFMRWRSFSTTKSHGLPNPHMSFRSFISALKSQNDLVEIEQEVDPFLEVAAVTRRVYENFLPAPLFQNISGKDEKSGLFNMLGAPVGLRKNKKDRYARLALQLGLDTTSSPKQIVEKIISAKDAKPLEPKKVSSVNAPCKEHVLKKSEIDMTKWPIPKLHLHDGGSFLGTYGFHILQSPDKSWTSWSISRTMLHGKQELVAPVMNGQHIHAVRQMWADSGAKETPWAMVLGGPPAAAFVAGMPLPKFVSEDGYVGALCGEPVEVVKCETNDLYVPANSELVIEGRISNSEKVPEGPMGEYHGYAFYDAPVLEPLFHVDCVTHRTNPTIPICVAGTAADETQTVWGTAISAELLHTLRTAGFPADFVWVPFEAQACWIVVSVNMRKLASLQTNSTDLCRWAGDLIFKTHAGWEIPKVILVGDDVDITNMQQLVWALATRYRPGADEIVFGKSKGIPMVPYMTRAERSKVPDPGRGGKSVVNLILPQEYNGQGRTWCESSFEGSYPENIKQKVKNNWTRYGFKDDVVE